MPWWAWLAVGVLSGGLAVVVWLAWLFKDAFR